jgi:glycosyltransferase involved in cell wall biosynthesis
MDVSVVIPTYNRAHVVITAIESALGQTRPPLEVVVVDDGSTDGTEARVRALGDARVRYLGQANGGVSAARNAGVRAATGTLVAFLDSDDVWKPDKLERDVAVLAAHPEVDAVFTDLDKHHGDVYVSSFTRACPPFAALLAQHREEGETIVFTPREMLLCLLQEVPIMPSAFTIRRDAFLRLGGFDTAWRSWEDWELFLRYTVAGGRFAYVDRPLATLVISRDSLHIIDSIGGQMTMLAFLLRQRERLRGDAEARAALRRGLRRLRRRMGWQHMLHQRRLAACVNYLRGFVEVGDVGMLVRAGAALVPGVSRRCSLARLRTKPTSA